MTFEKVVKTTTTTGFVLSLLWPDVAFQIVNCKGKVAVAVNTV